MNSKNQMFCILIQANCFTRVELQKYKQVTTKTEEIGWHFPVFLSQLLKIFDKRSSQSFEVRDSPFPMPIEKQNHIFKGNYEFHPSYIKTKLSYGSQLLLQRDRADQKMPESSQAECF